MEFLCFDTNERVMLIGTLTECALNKDLILKQNEVISEAASRPGMRWVVNGIFFGLIVGFAGGYFAAK